MRCEDGHAYVVKFQNNPQSPRVLANEWLATKIGASLGLPVPPCAVIDVGRDLIERTEDLKIDFGSHQQPCTPGLQFGSRLVGGLMPGLATDYLPTESLQQVVNLDEFAGCLVFDKWTCNQDGRQAVFHKKQRERQYRAAFIDQGFCFNADDWKLVDAPLKGVYARNAAYRNVTGWHDFEPWLTRVEEFQGDRIWDIASSIPQEWYNNDRQSLECLVEQLSRRRLLIRELIIQFRESSRDPFPNWGASKESQ